MSDHEAETIHSPVALSYVAVFITRDTETGREILLEHSAYALPRLPESVIKLGEQPEVAALRLASAVLGNEDVSIDSLLARLPVTLTGDERGVMRPSLLRAAPVDDATLMRFRLLRGMRVRVTGEYDDFTRVVYEEYALHENELAIATRRAGWVLDSVLTDQIEYFLFHLRAGDSSANPRMDIEAETLPVWIPLEQASGLAPEHEAWLERARPYLLRYSD